MTLNPHRGSDFADFLAEEGLMTPTPRTDAAIAASDGQWSFTLRDLAQQMERELAAERALADRLADALVESMERLGVCAGHLKVLDQWKEARRDP
jgi:hypothetical protein